MIASEGNNKRCILRRLCMNEHSTFKTRVIVNGQIPGRKGKEKELLAFENI